MTRQENIIIDTKTIVSEISISKFPTESALSRVKF